MAVVNTDGLASVLLDREDLMVRELLDEANSTIVELRKEIAEKNDVISQCLAKTRDDAITIARLRLRCENDAALARAVAQRDARDYAASMQRTAEVTAAHQR